MVLLARPEVMELVRAMAAEADTMEATGMTLGTVPLAMHMDTDTAPTEVVTVILVTQAARIAAASHCPPIPPIQAEERMEPVTMVIPAMMVTAATDTIQHKDHPATNGGHLPHPQEQIASHTLTVTRKEQWMVGPLGKVQTIVNLILP